jgi:hypothetical protein
VEQGAGDGGEEVGVFVGVDVGDGDAKVLELADLGAGFAGNIVGVNAAKEEIADKVDDGRTEGFAVGTYQGRDALGI